MHGGNQHVIQIKNVIHKLSCGNTTVHDHHWVIPRLCYSASLELGEVASSSQIETSQGALDFRLHQQGTHAHNDIIIRWEFSEDLNFRMGGMWPPGLEVIRHLTNAVMLILRQKAHVLKHISVSSSRFSGLRINFYST